MLQCPISNTIIKKKSHFFNINLHLHLLCYLAQLLEFFLVLFIKYVMRKTHKKIFRNLEKLLKPELMVVMGIILQLEVTQHL
jgi:heme/copper-type cytochrome/quinol oxidase subunit 3